jgi:hypothetical protein
MWLENPGRANFGSGHMKRRLVNIISGAFLVVAVLIGGCGVISLRDHRVLIHRRFDPETNMRVNAVASCDGALWIFSKVYFRRPGTTFVSPGWYFGPGSYGMDDRPWARPHYFNENNRAAYGHMLALPHWLVALLCLMLGFPSMNSVRRRLRERRRISRQQCPKCGYDLRSSGERCPECGEMVAKRPMEQRAAEV